MVSSKCRPLCFKCQHVDISSPNIDYADNAVEMSTFLTLEYLFFFSEVPAKKKKLDLKGESM